MNTTPADCKRTIGCAAAQGPTWDGYAAYSYSDVRECAAAKVTQLCSLRAVECISEWQSVDRSVGGNKPSDPLAAYSTLRWVNRLVAALRH